MSWDFDYPWQVLTNQISALHAAVRLGHPDTFDRQPDRKKSEITYVICYNTRNMVAMLLSTDTRHDGVRLNRLLPDFQSKTLNRLRREYGDDSIEGSPCALIGSMAEAPARIWRPRQDVAQAIVRVLPLIDKVWEEIQRLRPKRRRRKSADDGGSHAMKPIAWVHFTDGPRPVYEDESGQYTYENLRRGNNALLSP